MLYVRDYRRSEERGNQMTDNEKLSCLTDRPCTACKFHKEEGCSKWSCVFEDKSGDTEGEYIKIDDLDDTVLRLNNDGWEITRNEHKLISNVLYEMPLYSFPNIEKGEWIESTYQFCGRTLECIRCSNCNTPQDYYRTSNFCPNCGADMRGGKE